MQELSRREAAEQNAAGAPAPAPSVAPATSPIDPQQFERALVEEDSHYNVLLEEKETQRTLYDSVLDRLKEANISKGYEDAQVHVREAAIFPLYPSQPIIPLILAIAIFLGLVSGVGLAFTLNAMDSSFRTVDEAEHRLELHSLGAIPYVKGHDKEGTILVEDSNADQIVAESIRTLRASLKLMGRQEERKTFLFTSALPAEGKSFVTANCAVFLANEGSRVLIIDADLRKPTLHKIFNYSRSVEGLAEWLTRNEPLPNLVKPSPVPNLDVLVAGAPAPNPAELLSNCNFGILLSEAVQLYDYVLVDSAPIHAVGDTLLMCEYFQSTCLVIHAGNTPGSACVRALHLLEKAGAKMAGFILNRLPARAGYGSNSYYYYYQYSGKYGEAYGQAKAK